jgi:hypothetical protein
MPNIWDTSLPQTDANLFKLAVDEDSWKELLLPHFFIDEEDKWGGFWEEYGDNLIDGFNYEDRFGSNESLTKRAFSKGLSSFTNQAYGKIQKNMKNRASVGFAGSGSGLGMHRNTSNLWNDYQMGLVDKKNQMNSTITGFGEQFRGEVTDYLGQIASVGAFDFD